jgi:hypothetical protein
MNDTFQILKPRDIWSGIPALAERLGVKEGQGTGEIDIILGDGRKYSIYALVNAFLDKIETALEK